MRHRAIVSLCACVGLSCGELVTAARAAPPDERGHEIFTHKWLTHDRFASRGDGLGPMHNATSCVACHFQGGPGGGGDSMHNVELLSVIPPADARNFKSQRDFTNTLIALHPGFSDGKGSARSNIVLHRFGPEGDYFAFRAEVLGFEEPRPDTDPARRAVLAVAAAKRHGKRKGAVETLKRGAITFQRSQRNTPALWGAGLIDSIPTPVIEQVAKDQAKDAPELSGRVPRAADGGVGKFGWRGQTSSLREFVLNACANELGLQTKDRPQAINPLSPDYKAIEEDMTPADVEALVAFVANLPAPTRSTPSATFNAEPGRAR